MEGEGRLSDLPKKLQRQQWRWCWGFKRNHGETRLPSRLGIDYSLVIPYFTRVLLLTRVMIFLTIMPLIPFWTMEDMEELITEGKKRGISIIMDLVVNHCSSHHEWFQKALADPDGPYADYFYFIESDKEPNNWESYFGGSVWEPVPGTNKYYLHSYHKDQPDLNWQKSCLARRNLQDDQLVVGQGNCGL